MISSAPYSIALTPSGAIEELAGEPFEGRAHAVLALVADDDLHLGRFADEAAERPDRPFGDLAQHRPHADAADLLVIGDRKMDRRRQLRLNHLRHHCEADGDKSLHVGGAAAVKLAVALDERERVLGPVLSRDRNDVGVPRQHQTRPVFRPDGHPQRGLLSGLIDDPLSADTERGEIAFDIGDQREVGAIAHGIEGDEVGQELLDAVGSWAGHCLVHASD